MANAADFGGSPESAGEVKRELSDDAQRLKHTAIDQAESTAREGQQQATQAAHAASSAIQKAADELQQDDKAPEWLASAASSAARQVGDFAQQLENTNPREVVRWTTDFARTNPTSFLTVSAALGFAAARFLRAGADYQHDTSGGTSGGSGEMGTTYRSPTTPATNMTGTTTMSGTTSNDMMDRQIAPIGGYGDTL